MRLVCVCIFFVLMYIINIIIIIINSIDCDVPEHYYFVIDSVYRLIEFM